MHLFRGITLRAETRGLLALAISLLFGGAVYAGDTAGTVRDGATPDRRPDKPSAVRGPARSQERDARGLPFARKRILPRVSLQMQALTAFRHAEPNRDIAEQVFFEDMSRQVRRGVERATRRAVKDYLVDVMEVDRLVERIRHRGQGGAESQEPATRRKLRFDVGFHQLLPEVEMRYRAGRGSMKFSIDAEGAFGMQYRHNQVARTRVGAGFDGDDTYRLQLHVDF